MTVTEYRSRNPKCEYCVYRPKTYNICSATKKVIRKHTAIYCSCYSAEHWKGSDK